MRKLFNHKKKRKNLLFERSEQIIICKDCGIKHSISYPSNLVWDNGIIECGCGKIIKFYNDRIISLYI